jgi:hypothetical protein
VTYYSTSSQIRGTVFAREIQTVFLGIFFAFSAASASLPLMRSVFAGASTKKREKTPVYVRPVYVLAVTPPIPSYLTMP